MILAPLVIWSQRENTIFNNLVLIKIALFLDSQKTVLKVGYFILQDLLIYIITPTIICTIINS